MTRGAKGRTLPGVEIPETRYAPGDGGLIAYQVAGSGPADLVYMTGLASNVDARWDVAPMARFLERLASFSRVISFDRRGFGASDPVPSGILTWEECAHDLRAVMDAIGSERAAIFAENDDGPTALLFAATFPDRVTALVLANGAAKLVAGENYPGVPLEAATALVDMVERGWGTEGLVELVAASVAEDRRTIRSIAKFQRASATPTVAATRFRYALGLDIRGVLSSIHVPTLIIQREQSMFIPTSIGRHLADNISAATYVEVPGGDIFCCTQGEQEILDRVQQFLTGQVASHDSDRVLATVLFTDIVDSTRRAGDVGDRRWKELLDAHDDLIREQIEGFGGRVVKTTGDGVLATFDSPGRAIRCGLGLHDRLHSIGIDVRAGLHTGEVELRGEDVGGIAVHLAARVAALASAGELLVSRTVTDLVSGSGIEFEDRGEHALKGVPGEWRLFAVKT